MIGSLRPPLSHPTSLSSADEAGSGEPAAASSSGLAPDDVAGDVHQKLAPGRRAAGRFYTPAPLVALVTELAAEARGARPVAAVLDPATGSGRFLVAAGRRWPDARLVGVDLDPVALALARGHCSRAGLHPELVLGDALAPDTPLHRADVVLGNPPYGHRPADAHLARVLAPFAFPVHWFDADGAPAPYDPTRRGRVPGPEQNRGKLADLVPWFLGLALHRLEPGGVAALLTSSAWLSIPTWRFLRRHLLTRTTIEWIVDFNRPSCRDSVFLPDAGIAVCAVVLRASPPPPDHRIRLVDLSGLPDVRRRYEAIARVRWRGAGRHHPDLADWELRPLAELPAALVPQAGFLERRDHVLRRGLAASPSSPGAAWRPLTRQVATQPGVDPGDLRHLVAPDEVTLRARVGPILAGDTARLHRTARAWIEENLARGTLGGPFEPARVVPFVFQKDIVRFGARAVHRTYLHPRLLWRARLPDDGDRDAPVRARHRLLVVERRERGELVAAVVGEHAVAQHGGRLLTVPESADCDLDLLHALCALINSTPVQLRYREQSQGDKDIALPEVRALSRAAELARLSRRLHAGEPLAEELDRCVTAILGVPG